MGYGKINDGAGKEITIKRVKELYEFLQGALPEGMEMTLRPKLSERKAFNIIWFLQEYMDLIPDRFERCCRCGEIYDSWDEGDRKGDSNYCMGC